MTPQLTLVLVAQACSTLCNPMDCSPPRSLSTEFSRQELLAIYFIFILDEGNYVRQRVNSSNFLSEFKMSPRAETAETTCNINSALGPGTAYECKVQWWFERFCKGDESLEDEHSDQPSERNH